jgi:iron complex outermembrane receptor protein
MISGILCGAAAAAPAPAHAADPYVSVVTAAPDAGNDAPDPSANVTVIDARTPSARAASVADLIEHEAGVRIRSRGGLGSFTSVSLRGSEESEVAVFVDDVPLSRAASGAIDLSQLPADGLERVEIYRGVPPVELGAEAIGGVIRLVTKKGARRRALRGSAGLGSFGARSAALSYGDRKGALFTSASLAYRGATGDFTYYDNGGTLFNPTDDRVSVRRNNQFDQVALDAALRRRAPPVEAGGGFAAAFGAHGFIKRQGVPGLADLGRESLHASLTTGRVLLDGALAREGQRTSGGVTASLLYERSAFSNPAGEAVGVFGPDVSEGEAISAELRGRFSLRIGRLQQLEALGEARLEHRRASNLLDPGRSGLPSRRVSGAVALVDHLRLLSGRVTIDPAVRLDAAGSALLTDGAPGPEEATQLFFSPRISASAQVTTFFRIAGGAGRFVRFPTLLEQFGDGAFILGGPRLRPETAWGGELSATLSSPSLGPRHRVHGSFEASFFGRQVSDLIAFQPGGNTVSAYNVGQARVFGVELHARAAVRWAAITASYAYLDAEDRTATDPAFGRTLPGRAAHQLEARAELNYAPFTLAYDVDYVSDVYRDPLNYNRLPGRALHGLSLVFRHRWLSVEIEVRNLADLRIIDLPLGGSAQAGNHTPYPLTDFFNYPLPGRALYATVAAQR